MTTSILILCFSVAVILLLTALLIRGSQDSDKREQRMTAATERLTTILETVASQQATTMQKASSDTADLVVKAIESTNETMTNLFLGREQQIDRLLERQNEENEKQPIPGIETLQGLPKNVQDALMREEHELTRPDWLVVSTPQPNGSEPISESPWTLENDLPLS